MLPEIFATPPSIPGLEARILVAVAFTAAATYYDVFNKKWVPNFLLYSFAAAALLLNVVFFEQSVFLPAVVFGVLAFALSYPLYKAGQLGGADMFCYSSIAMAIPYLPQPLLAPQATAPYPFILSVLIPTGLVFIAHMFARFIPYAFLQARRGKLGLPGQKLAAPAMLLAAFAIFLWVLLSMPVSFPPAYFALLIFLFGALLFFSVFKEMIKDSMVEQVAVSKLQEEDVLALEKMDPSLVGKLGLAPLISAKAIAALKRAKLKSVPVYTKMPFFLPYLFIGLLFTLLFGDVVSYIAASGGF